MSASNSHVCVFVAQTNEGISAASRNLLQRVSAVYKGLDASVEAIIIGENNQQGNDSLNRCGVNKITHLKCSSPLLQTHAVKKAVLDLIPDDGIVHIYSLNELLLTGLTASVAAAKRWPMFAGCSEINNIASITRPIFGGKIDEIRNVSEVSCVISVRPVKENIDYEPVQVEYKSIEITENTENHYIITLPENQTQKSITDASIVISGGRGLKSAENFSMLFKFAEVVDGAVGASRPVVDSGWISHEHQVGQTGQTISPNLYIACGISGSVQHMAGMSASKCIVAINTDKDAPIFSIADYGIIGDALEILPQLTAEIEKLK